MSAPLHETRMLGDFVVLPETPQTLEYLEGMVPLRGGLFLDPGVAEPWSCDPERCRPVLGKNLCCKVQLRCKHLGPEGLCEIHASKPFGCALFPLDLFRIGAARVVAGVQDPRLHDRAWTRFDRDMLGCFAGEMPPDAQPMLLAQLPELSRVFTRSELELMKNAVKILRQKRKVEALGK